MQGIHHQHHHRCSRVLISLQKSWCRAPIALDLDWFAELKALSSPDWHVLAIIFDRLLERQCTNRQRPLRATVASALFRGYPSDASTSFTETIIPRLRVAMHQAIQAHR